MATFEPVLTRNFAVPDSHLLKTYESRGATRLPARRSPRWTPTRWSRSSRIRSFAAEGGAGFPTGLKWSFLPKDRQETFMCVNGDESEPATFNNRLLIELDPHQFIEGILIGCFATKAATAYVYLRFEYIHAFRIMERRSPRPGRPGTWARTSTGRASTWRSTATGGPGLTSAARKPG